MSFGNLARIFNSTAFKEVVSELATKTYPELFLFTVAIFLYAVFTKFLYMNLSKRDLFKLDLSKYDIQKIKFRRFRKIWHVLLYFVKYGLVFPFYVSFWFIAFSLMLFIMTKETAAIDIIVISIAFVSAVRTTAYFKEELSKELAKLIPFALLAIMISDPNFFSFELFLDRISDVSFILWEVLKYLSFCILFEWLLRTLYAMHSSIKNRRKKAKNSGQSEESKLEFG